MKYILIALVFSFGLQAQTKAKIREFEQRAKHENWTFRFSEKPDRARGLVKKKFQRREHLRLGQVEIADTMDLRPKLTPIEDQGECGSCWAFSLTATLRDGYALMGKDPGALSQQYLVDCAKTQSGCEGGYFDAADYFIFPHNAPSLSDYPYTAQEGRCKSAEANTHALGWHLLGDASGPSQRDIESYMTQYQKTVSTIVAAGAGPWMHYDEGVYNACEFAETDHMINIVGWDNEGEAFDEHGNLPPGKGVWILRNSWGTEWGEKGWMRTRMTDITGRRCNNIAEEVAYLDFDTEPDAAPPGVHQIYRPFFGKFAWVWAFVILNIVIAIICGTRVAPRGRRDA